MAKARPAMQADVGAAHRLDLAADADEAAARQVPCCSASTMLSIVAADRAEVAILHGAVDIEDAADVVVGDDRHLGGARDAGDVARISGWLGRVARGDRDVLQVLQRLHVVLRRLRDDVVVDAVLRVEEEHAA